jgi:hypothetical protein
VTCTKFAPVLLILTATACGGVATGGSDGTGSGPTGGSIGTGGSAPVAGAAGTAAGSGGSGGASYFGGAGGQPAIPPDGSASGGAGGDAAIDVADGDAPDADATAGRAPAEHRASPVLCPSDRPESPPLTSPPAGSLCVRDADCTAGRNGRCNARGFEAGELQCSYDECVTDADCLSGEACFCRAPFANGANVCVAADCRFDADCGPGGFCSSTQNVNGMLGDRVVRCHTAADECLNDSECGDGGWGALCEYDPDVSRWLCTRQWAVP